MDLGKRVSLNKPTTSSQSGSHIKAPLKVNARGTEQVSQDPPSAVGDEFTRSGFQTSGKGIVCKRVKRSEGGALFTVSIKENVAFATHMEKVTPVLKAIVDSKCDSNVVPRVIKNAGFESIQVYQVLLGQNGRNTFEESLKADIQAFEVGGTAVEREVISISAADKQTFDKQPWYGIYIKYVFIY